MHGTEDGLAPQVQVLQNWLNTEDKIEKHQQVGNTSEDSGLQTGAKYNYHPREALTEKKVCVSGEVIKWEK